MSKILETSAQPQTTGALLPSESMALTSMDQPTSPLASINNYRRMIADTITRLAQKALEIEQSQPTPTQDGFKRQVADLVNAHRQIDALAKPEVAQLTKAEATATHLNKLVELLFEIVKQSEATSAKHPLSPEQVAQWRRTSVLRARNIVDALIKADFMRVIDYQGQATVVDGAFLARLVEKIEARIGIETTVTGQDLATLVLDTLPIKKVPFELLDPNWVSIERCKYHLAKAVNDLKKALNWWRNKPSNFYAQEMLSAQEVRIMTILESVEERTGIEPSFRAELVADLSPSTIDSLRELAKDEQYEESTIDHAIRWLFDYQ